MLKNKTLSNQTRRNWWIDAGLMLGALLAALSGVYFLFFPSGGYQGGRNPLAQIVILFERHTWSDVHTWSGVLMITFVVVHLSLHWSWVTSMARRTWKELRGQVGSMNGKGRFNVLINLVIACSFFLCALSGIYFLFVPGGYGAADPGLIFSRLTWDLIHTWSAVALIVAAVLHFAIHWRWITKVSRNILESAIPASRSNQVGEQVVSTGEAFSGNLITRS